MTLRAQVASWLEVVACGAERGNFGAPHGSPTHSPAWRPDPAGSLHSGGRSQITGGAAVVRRPAGYAPHRPQEIRFRPRVGILALDQPIGLDPFAFRPEWDKHHKPTERYGPPRPREV